VAVAEVAVVIVVDLVDVVGVLEEEEGVVGVEVVVAEEVDLVIVVVCSSIYILSIHFSVHSLCNAHALLHSPFLLSLSQPVHCRDDNNNNNFSLTFGK
jgi:hypothetical protein